MKRRGLFNFLIVAGLVLALIVGCSVLLRSGSDGGGDGGAAGGDNGDETATMTFAQFQSAKLGQTQEQVEDKFGTPTDRQVLIDEGLIPDDETTQNCIYYKADPPTFGEWFEFCFDAGKLVNKTSL